MATALSSAPVLIVGGLQLAAGGVEAVPASVIAQKNAIAVAPSAHLAVSVVVISAVCQGAAAVAVTVADAVPWVIDGRGPSVESLVLAE